MLVLRNKGKARESMREVGEARQLAAVKRTLRNGGVREGKCNSACKESKV